MTIPVEHVRRFMALFAGYQKAYGTFDPRKQGENGKVVGRALTLRGAPTEDLYGKHLLGQAGLGVVMLREDDTVMFGAIDYDVKTMDHVKAEEKLRRLQLPLVLCRSKSGGGHFYCFVKEPVLASTMRDRLSEWTALLGMAATTEQFPKQSNRYNDDDVGSWINLPYFNAPATTRYAVHEGVGLDLAAFLDLAERSQVLLEQMEKPAVPESALFEEGPPCLMTLYAQGGFAEGTKKDGMFNVAVYLKKRFPDDWQERIDEYNRAMANIKSDEVQTIVKSINKKEYAYKCKQPPLNSCCQRRLCMTRMHGVGAGDSGDGAGFTIGSVTRYEPEDNNDDPMWGMEVNGRRVFLTTAQLYSRDDFNRACLSQANVVPVHMPPARWLKKIGEMVASAEIIPMPSDAGPVGQLWDHIEEFATQDIDAKAKDEIFQGKPWRDDDGSVYFRSMDLFAYLDARRIAYKSQQAVFLLIRKKKGGKTFWNISKRGVNVWHMPQPVSREESNQALINVERTVAF